MATSTFISAVNSACRHSNKASSINPNTAIASIYNLSESSSQSKCNLYTVSSTWTTNNPLRRPRQQRPTPSNEQSIPIPQSIITTITHSANSTVSSIEEWLPELQSNQIIADIVSQNKIDYDDTNANDDESRLNVLNAITS
eukprot:CAMPEP_0201567024 /NCGR_PEP_ID=MMETSP0190_2-20130828/7277_1 /ASSEMBLY_ACC=CAM_ASM_000263 /TAXON_ID=37353 /ORGANISM="Rosalina sp." /LENGTH=140 /DNA_ID=CAMNT_0047986509 /DNA_START=24 /DNA_END=442 /DNA_ORIENTATION=+